MKSLNDLSEEEFEDLVRRAAALPDAPQAWVGRAVRTFVPSPVVTAADVAQAAWRLVAGVLRFDSWTAAPQAAPVRGLPGSVRHLLFSAEGRDIDLRITPSADQFALMGQVLGPDDDGVVELCAPADTSGAAAAPLHTTLLDDLGEFRIEGVARGTYLLTLRVGRDAIALPPIEIGERLR